jgi:hypothetical protein
MGSLVPSLLDVLGPIETGLYVIGERNESAAATRGFA